MKKNSVFRKFEYTLEKFSYMKIDNELQSLLHHIDYSTLRYDENPKSVVFQCNLDLPIQEKFNLNHLFLSKVVSNTIDGSKQILVIFVNHNNIITITNQEELEKEMKDKGKFDYSNIDFQH